MSIQEKHYIKGFNHGYILSKFIPTLLAKLVDGIKSINDYEIGFLAGKSEFEKEKSKSKLDELNEIRKDHGDKSLDREIN